MIHGQYRYQIRTTDRWDETQIRNMMTTSYHTDDSAYDYAFTLMVGTGGITLLYYYNNIITLADIHLYYVIHHI